MVEIVGPAVAEDFPDLVAGIGGGDVLGAAGQVMGQAGEGALRGAVAVGGSGAVAQGDHGPPREVVVEVGGETGAAQLLDHRRPVEGVAGGGDIEGRGFRPGGPGSVACRVGVTGQMLRSTGKIDEK